MSRAADKLQLALRQAGRKITVAGVPKTIDNDVGAIDRRDTVAAKRSE